MNAKSEPPDRRGAISGHKDVKNTGHGWRLCPKGEDMSIIKKAAKCCHFS